MFQVVRHQNKSQRHRNDTWEEPVSFPQRDQHAIVGYTTQLGVPTSHWGLEENIRASHLLLSASACFKTYVICKNSAFLKCIDKLTYMYCLYIQAPFFAGSVYVIKKCWEAAICLYFLKYTFLIIFSYDFIF